MTDIRYISTKEAAGIMGLSTRRVVGLCNAGKLEGALRKGRNWMVPEETVYAYLGTAKPKEENGEILSCAVGNTSYMDVVKNSYYVVDADIEKFFDNVNQGKLMKLVEQRISDRRILKLIKQSRVREKLMHGITNARNRTFTQKRRVRIAEI